MQIEGNGHLRAVLAQLTNLWSSKKRKRSKFASASKVLFSKPSKPNLKQNSLTFHSVTSTLYMLSVPVSFFRL